MRNRSPSVLPAAVLVTLSLWPSRGRAQDAQGANDLARAAAMITDAELARHVAVLAHDSTEGRLMPSRARRVTWREDWQRYRFWPDSVTRDWPVPPDSVLDRPPTATPYPFHLEVVEQAGLPLLIGTDIGADGIDRSRYAFS